MSECLWIEPQDVLYLRGNKLFGAAGDDALAQMPPWPSVAAGAIRSRMLVDHGVCLPDFAGGKATLSDDLAVVLGSPEEPGTFRIAHFGLAGREKDQIEPLFPLPSDMVVFNHEDGSLDVVPLTPQPLPDGIRAATQTPCIPVMKTVKQRKPVRGYWLNGRGIAAYVQGESLHQEHLIETENLWKVDSRLGIALDEDQRTAAPGKIYTTDAIDMHSNVGFVAMVEGAEAFLPTDGLLRFGGDGRAAEVRGCDFVWPQMNWQEIEHSRCFRLVLTSPGVFEDGWALPGMQKDGRWYCGSGSARLVSAALSRCEVISGWDIASHQPKPAQRVAATGSVYWLDDWQGDISELEKVAQHGLPCHDNARRAEGFNHCMITRWEKEE